MIVAWNSRLDLERCLISLHQQDYAPCELIVVDNASTDGTVAWLTTTYPDIQVLQNEQNIGFAAGVNQGFAAARGEVLVELNPDTTVEADWLFPLVEAIEQPEVGLVTSRVMLMKEPSRINACGNEMSLTGLTFCIALGEKAERFAHKAILPVPAISGAAFAMSRACYQTIGGFDPDYFTYFEDTDLSWRARLAGFDIVLATNSVVYHDYEFRFSAQKMYWIERNRHLTLLKHLRKDTLLRLLPALLLGEAIAWGYALLRGVGTLNAKARALRWLITHRDEIRHRRASVQALRTVEDDVLVSRMTSNIRFDQTIKGPLGRWMNRLTEPLLGWWQREVMKIQPASQPLT